MIVMNAKLHFTDWLFEDNVLFGCDGCLDNLSERDDLSENVVRKMCYILDHLLLDCIGLAKARLQLQRLDR